MPLAGPGEPEEELFEDDVPLGGLPYTGTITWQVPALLLLGLLALGMGFALRRKKKEEE